MVRLWAWRFVLLLIVLPLVMAFGSVDVALWAIRAIRAAASTLRHSAREFRDMWNFEP